MTLDEWREIQKPLMKKFILTQKALAQNFINDSLKDEEKLNKEKEEPKTKMGLLHSYSLLQKEKLSR